MRAKIARGSVLPSAAMTSRRERRRRRESRPPTQNSRPPRRRGPRKPWLLTTAVVLVVLVFAVAGALFSEPMIRAVVSVPCRLSGCAAPASAAGGWLIPAALLAWIGCGL